MQPAKNLSLYRVSAVSDGARDIYFPKLDVRSSNLLARSRVNIDRHVGMEFVRVAPELSNQVGGNAASVTGKDPANGSCHRRGLPTPFLS
jgi:hypothetical protein